MLRWGMVDEKVGIHWRGESIVYEFRLCFLSSRIWECFFCVKDLRDNRPEKLQGTRGKLSVRKKAEAASEALVRGATGVNSSLYGDSTRDLRDFTACHVNLRRGNLEGKRERKPCTSIAISHDVSPSVFVRREPTNRGRRGTGADSSGRSIPDHLPREQRCFHRDYFRVSTGLKHLRSLFATTANISTSCLNLSPSNERFLFQNCNIFSVFKYI